MSVNSLDIHVDLYIKQYKGLFDTTRGAVKDSQLLFKSGWKQSNGSKVTTVMSVIVYSKLLQMSETYEESVISNEQEIIP